MNRKTNTVRAILLDATECDRPEADHPATIEISADDLQRILERHITEPAQCLNQIAEPAACVEKQIEEVMGLVSDWQIKNDIAGDAALDAHDPECSEADSVFAEKCHEEQLSAWEAIRAKLRTLLSSAQSGEQAAPQAAGRVYLVATGEVRNGMELYERHDAPVPLAECEVLYTVTAHPAEGVPAQAFKTQVYQALGIGSACDEHVAFVNIENLCRRADCLSAIEREFFMVETPPDESEGDLEPGEECLLNWAHSPEQYVKQFAEALAATQPAAQGLDAREFPPMKPELASILGLMCFQCISFAQALRAAGRTIQTSAEDEQAAVLHWMLGHYFRHGEDWRTAAAADMERMKAEALAAQAKQGGAA